MHQLLNQNQAGEALAGETNDFLNTEWRHITKTWELIKYIIWRQRYNGVNLHPHREVEQR
ncbi:MAG: hypothetical protein JWO92_2043 [Chitinophagaceae bacterium]|nr:hypothetical protein [Chitinophagaceae bacterium]